VDKNDDSLIVLTDWHMSKRVGIDSVICDQAEPKNDATKKKREWFINGSSFPLMPSDDSAARKKLLQQQADLLKRSFALDCMDWAGVTTSPRIEPGCIVNISDFYGVGDDQQVQARVISLKTRIIERLPEGYPNMTDEDPELTVKFKAIEYGKDAVKPMIQPEETMLQTAPLLYRAIVCNDKQTKFQFSMNNTPCTLMSDAKKSGMFFYAMLEGADKPVRVRFTMPLGGEKQGLFRLPRIGDQILVMDAGNGSYLLNSYLPGREYMQFADTNTNLIGGMTVIRHNTTNNNATPVYSKADSAAKGAEKPDPKYYNKIQYSEVGMYSDQNGDVMRLQTPGCRYDHTEKDHIVTAHNILFASPDTSNTKKNEREFNVADFQRVVIQAEKEIRFQVGRCYITIDEKGIELHARQSNSMGGALDGVVYVMPHEAGMVGNRIFIASQLNTNISNGTGELISMGAGALSMYSSYTSISSADKKVLTWAKVLNAA